MIHKCISLCQTTILWWNLKKAMSGAFYKIAPNPQYEDKSTIKSCLYSVNQSFGEQLFMVKCTIT